jgi:hypothetical protein
MTFTFLLLATLQLFRGCHSLSDSSLVDDRAAQSESTPILDIFQVEAPLRKSYDGTSCKQVVIQHEFAASYGTPYVGMRSLILAACA